MQKYYKLEMFCVLQNKFPALVFMYVIIFERKTLMTTYNGKINLFDCATAQKVIGQETFLNAFKTTALIVRDRKPENWKKNSPNIREQNTVQQMLPVQMP